ncbi:MAG: hypothetical protein AAGJ35_04835, partial [Myxococcota bacterium]
MRQNQGCPQIYKFYLTLLFTWATCALPSQVWSANTCTQCHRGLAPIRAHSSGMMKAILKIARNAGHPGNDCIVCHGGNPQARAAKAAHQGTLAYFQKHPGPKNFYPDPGSPWINQHTCGMCHQEQVRTQFTSLMFTEAGKIQGTLWGFGGINRYQHNIGNHNVKMVPEHQILGTPKYKK